MLHVFLAKNTALLQCRAWWFRPPSSKFLPLTHCYLVNSLTGQGTVGIREELVMLRKPSDTWVAHVMLECELVCQPVPYRLP